MSTYEPGTVAVATVRGVPNVRIFRYHEGRAFRWDSGERVGDSIVHSDHEVTDIRPLVVLDPHEIFSGTASTEDRTQRLVRFLREIRDWGGQRQAGGNVHIDALIYQIEAQTRPPRIPEPGLWGVVEAGVKEHEERLNWVRLGDNYRPDDGDEYDRLWSDLVDPTLVRPGIEDGAS